MEDNPKDQNKKKNTHLVKWKIKEIKIYNYLIYLKKRKKIKFNTKAKNSQILNIKEIKAII